jgi:hypothetical protein
MPFPIAVLVGQGVRGRTPEEMAAAIGVAIIRRIFALFVGPGPGPGRRVTSKEIERE